MTIFCFIDISRKPRLPFPLTGCFRFGMVVRKAIHRQTGFFPFRLAARDKTACGQKT